MTYAVTHEPSRFVCAEIEHPLELKGAESLLAGAHNMDGVHPLLEIDMRALKDSTHRDGELIPANPAFPQAFPSRTL